MLKLLLIISLFPLLSLAQTPPGEKLSQKAKVVTDSGVYKGYFIKGNDSAIQISLEKRFSGNAILNIPVTSIHELQIRNKTGTNAGVIAAVTVFGFIVTAGLTKNGGDIDNDGKTSFFELLFTAIEGTTSSNRHRRNTALIVGAAGGTLFMIGGFFATKKLSLNFPLNDRANFYRARKHELNDYTRF